MTAPLILAMPGASFMRFQLLDDGRVEVRCPGCHEVRIFAGDSPGSAVSAAFVHRDGCPVHARIREAVAEYEHAVVRHHG